MRVKSTYLDSAVLSSRDLSTTDPQSKLELARCIDKQRRRGRDSLADRQCKAGENESQRQLTDVFSQSDRKTMQQTQNVLLLY